MAKKNKDNEVLIIKIPWHFKEKIKKGSVPNFPKREIKHLLKEIIVSATNLIQLV